jgi:VanZ family protein
MRTDTCAFLCALAVVAQIFTLNALLFELVEPRGKVWNAGDELRQALLPQRTADALDFAADALAAVLTGATLLLLRGRPFRPPGSPS